LNADSAILLVPYGEDPLRQLAELLLDRHAGELPDLGRHAVLFPHTAASRFRGVLLDAAAARGYSALLPPWSGAFFAWLTRFADPAKRPLSDCARTWRLFEALQDFPALRQRYGTWPLIESLLTLFDELTCHRGDLADDPEKFQELIAGGYGTTAGRLSLFDEETSLVHTLWRAWQTELSEAGLQDEAQRTADALRRSLERLPGDVRLYLVGFVEFTTAELAWIESLRSRRQITVVLHGQSGAEGYHPDSLVTQTLRTLGDAPLPADRPDAYSAFLTRAYALADGELPARAQAQARATPASPARARLVIHEAVDAEYEARAIDLQVRRYLLEGRRNIGIVTNDRRLARRVRALLERAHVTLEDAGGWALSTTSAATSLVRWLECIEQDFAHDPLLDLLKSPFVGLGPPHAEQTQAVLRFEQAVVRAHNIPAGLQNYRHALTRAAADLDRRFGAGAAAGIGALLDRMEEASRPLQHLLRAARPVALRDFLETLWQGLERLGLTSGFVEDAAGSQILDILEDMRATARTARTLRLSWAELRQWLQRNLERSRFHPSLPGQGVELMSFAESRSYCFDALVVAGALHEHLPGETGLPPFFNDGVRTHLGLPGRERRYSSLFYDFRRLLEAAPHVLISLRRERDGELLRPSPWVERLRAFHALAYGATLADESLKGLAMSPQAVLARHEAPLPPPVTGPAATTAAGLVPRAMTATACQCLVDCPYRYYGAFCLGLRPEEEVYEEMKKSDFGKNVHLILQAFHIGVRGLPGPWDQPHTAATRTAAETLLREISQAVFARDIARRFSARGWLYRWFRILPDYLDWEWGRAATWRAAAAEIQGRQDLSDERTRLTLMGRIDRLDRGTSETGLIDYKTGAVPDRNEVLSGEQVQLPFYALLAAEDVQQAMFLALSPTGVSEKAVIAGVELAYLVTATRTRLLQLQRAMEDGARLPAWGDNQSCTRCELEGLCRREMWAVPETG
jgi:ATP-dependent helicase/nuclease subunit B